MQNHSLRSWVQMMLLVVSVLMVVGCSPSLPKPPNFPTANEIAGFEEGESSVPTGLTDDTPVADGLLPGDVVRLRMVSVATEEVDGVAVDERGMIHVPLAGDVDVMGVTLSEAEQRIERALSRYDRTIRVTVMLRDPLGHRATVVGAVRNPGRYFVSPGTRVADLLASAGGELAIGDEVPVSADLFTARVIRAGVALPISVALAIQGDPKHNVRIRAGDQMFVPAQLRGTVSVLGQVGAPRVFPYMAGIRLTQALALSGGVTRDGNWGDVRVIRGPSDRPKVYSASVASIVDGDAPDVVLAAGDIVYVSSAGHADLRDVMNSISPLLTTITNGAVAGGIIYSTAR